MDLAFGISDAVARFFEGSGVALKKPVPFEATTQGVTHTHIDSSPFDSSAHLAMSHFCNTSVLGSPNQTIRCHAQVSPQQLHFTTDSIFTTCNTDAGIADQGPGPRRATPLPRTAPKQRRLMLLVAVRGASCLLRELHLSLAACREEAESSFPYGSPALTVWRARL